MLRQALGVSACLFFVCVTFSPDSLARDLTFEDRVRAQEAIERVYYTHQIGTRRPFDEAVPRTLLEEKVTRYLRESVALEEVWGRPLTATDLSREFERIASTSLFPDRLAEIYDALDHDSEVIQECLVRPILVHRLTRMLFKADNVVHARPDRETEFTWDAWWQRESATFDASKVRSVALPLQIQSQPGYGLVAGGESATLTGSRVAPRVESSDNCGTWQSMTTANAPSARSHHTAVWTGTVMIIWGGGWSQTGGQYDPLLNAWIATSTNGAPGRRNHHTAVWDGQEMIVWGGELGGEDQFGDGGLFNPTSNRWRPLSMDNAPDARSRHTAVWAGEAGVMVVWGGRAASGEPDPGGRYEPETDTWEWTSLWNAPSPRFEHSAVWTGSEMLIWGAGQKGGRYDPVGNVWSSISWVNDPNPNAHYVSVWTGTTMWVWDDYYLQGSRYNPATDSWGPAFSTQNAPESRWSSEVIWTGDRMVLWGGRDGNTNEDVGTGAIYDGSSWTEVTLVGAPAARSYHTAIWTDTQMIVWGGFQYPAQASFNTGGRYTPGTAVDDDGDGYTECNGDCDDSNASIHPNAVEACDGVDNDCSPGTADGSAEIWHGAPCDGPDSDFCEEGALVCSGGAQSCSDSTLGTTEVCDNEIDDDCDGDIDVDCEDRFSELINVSTRGQVGTGANVMIGGFIIEGTEPKRVLVRSLGPTLSEPPFNVPGALANPQLTLTTVTGTVIASNDDWRNDVHETEIQAAGLAPPDDLEPATVVTLDPGAYTPIVSGENEGSGVGIIEIYTLDDGSMSRLSNVSTRGQVGTGADVLIGGFIIEGAEPRPVLVRALGPTLSAPPFNVPGALADPQLVLTTVAGTVIASNNDWRAGGQEDWIQLTSLAPPDDLEPAIIVTLEPGAYTPIVSGVSNGTGVGIVEVYELAMPSSPVLEHAEQYPVGIEIVHLPNPVRAIEGGPSGWPYTWMYATTAQAISAPVSITEFGAYNWDGSEWVLGNFTGEPFSSSDFAAWYSCPDAILQADQSCTDGQNWSGSSTLQYSQTKWVYVGSDPTGQPVRGEAIIEHLGELGP